MELIRDLLIQIAIIILPLFLYEAIRLNRYQEMPPKPNRYFIMFLSSVTRSLHDILYLFWQCVWV